ncbi:hypothetical protein Emed_006470 [Eimeria media]
MQQMHQGGPLPLTLLSGGPPPRDSNNTRYLWRTLRLGGPRGPSTGTADRKGAPPLLTKAASTQKEFPTSQKTSGREQRQQQQQQQHEQHSLSHPFALAESQQLGGLHRQQQQHQQQQQQREQLTQQQ